MNTEHIIMTMQEKRQVKLVTERKPLQLGELTLECAVGQHEDGSYIDLLIGKNLHEVFGNRGRHHENIVLLDSLNDKSIKVYVPTFLAAEGLRQFILPSMWKNFKPYIYKTHGMTSYAYDVDIIRDICIIYSRAWRNDQLLPQQSRIASQAIDLLEALAGVGLHALVQEAVGWHRGDLQNLFNRYLVDTPEKWREMFHRKYCQLAFDLHGRTFSHKHPRWFMGFVWRSVYKWVPQVLNDEINVRDPIIDAYWRRKVKKHQILSIDEGRKLVSDQIGLAMIAGRKTQKYAKRLGKTLVTCRPYYWQELRDICEEEQLIQAAWDRALAREDDQGSLGLPLFS